MARTGRPSASPAPQNKQMSVAAAPSHACTRPEPRDQDPREEGKSVGDRMGEAGSRGGGCGAVGRCRGSRPRLAGPSPRAEAQRAAWAPRTGGGGPAVWGRPGTHPDSITQGALLRRLPTPSEVFAGSREGRVCHGEGGGQSRPVPVSRATLWAGGPERGRQEVGRRERRGGGVMRCGWGGPQTGGAGG